MLLGNKIRYYEGGHSVCRNPVVQKMFVFLGIGEKGGAGLKLGSDTNVSTETTTKTTETTTKTQPITTETILDLFRKNPKMAAKEMFYVTRINNYGTRNKH